MSDLLSTYASRDWISEHQRKAGELFHDDYRTMTRPGRFPGYDKRGQSGRKAEGFSMTGIAAHRFHKACRHLGELRHVAFAVCIEGKPPHEWAKEVGHKASDGVANLRLALSALHRFYGEG